MSNSEFPDTTDWEATVRAELEDALRDLVVPSLQFDPEAICDICGVKGADAGGKVDSTAVSVCMDIADAHKGIWTNAFQLAKKLALFLIERQTEWKLNESALWKPLLKLRSNCSGLGAAEEASLMINAAAKEVKLPVHIESNSACDIDKMCRHHLDNRHFGRAGSNNTSHAFVDILNWLPKEVRDEVRDIEETDTQLQVYIYIYMGAHADVRGPSAAGNGGEGDAETDFRS